MRGRVLFLVVLTTSPVWAQPSIRTVPESVSCARCRIEITHVGVIGGTTDREGLVISNSKIARDSRGRILVAPSADRGQILVYDSTRRLTGRFGRLGKGPGEFDDITGLWFGPGDSLHVMDLERYSVLTPDFVAVRTSMGHNPLLDIVIYSNGASVQPFARSVPGNAQLPVHLLAPDGSIRRSFGADPPLTDYRDGYGKLRTLALSRNGMVWSANHTEYRLELWDTLGVLRQRLTRDAAWFRPWHTPDVTGRRIFAIREDESGLLWVLINLYNNKSSMLEVIDPRAATVVARTELPFLAFQFAGDWVYASKYTAGGDGIVLDVYRMRLIRR